MSNLIPVSRKEQYLSKIDGMTNKSPDKTYTKEEYFFSEILGEALHKPVLETRYEMYLAKIAGREIGIPYPETRLERFLAKAAGMNISVPTPITREEMYWSTYSPFYLSNSSGTSPLTYGKCKIGTLSNYRIYGNTVDGNSVGDRTGNLFNGVIEQGTISADGTPRDASNRVRTKNFTVLDAGTYTIQSSNNVGEISVFIFTYTDDGTFIKRLPIDWVALPYSFTLSERAKVKIVFEYTREEAINPSDVKNIMLNTGSTALPYEPYGYKVPVTVEGKNLLDFDAFASSMLETESGTTSVQGQTITLTASKTDYYTYPYLGNQSGVYKIPVLPNTKYVLSWETDNNKNGRIYVFLNGSLSDAQTVPQTEKSIKFITQDDTIYATIRFGVYSAGDSITYSNIQLNKGSTVLPYEPYHAPVTTPIYLPEPIKMVGDEAEYIEYGTQKMYRIGADNLDVTLPALPTVTGTNVLSVGTEVQPSEVEVRGRITPVPTGGGE